MSAAKVTRRRTPKGAPFTVTAYPGVWVVATAAGSVEVRRAYVHEAGRVLYVSLGSRQTFGTLREVAEFLIEWAEVGA